MIKSLSVENYALIDKTEIDLNKGFSVITGETGAGKSILLGALGLVFGERADINVLRDKDKKCIVEVCCDMHAYNLNKFFELNDLDYENETFIRREISPKGKSRAFVNDTPVNLKTLRELSLRLIDIHSQHQTQTLLDKYYQLGAIDSFAGIEKTVKDYKAGYDEYTNLKQSFRELKELADKESADYDYFQFQYTQLEEAALSENEQTELEAELETLNHAEEIKTTLLKSYSALEGEEYGVLNSLKDIENLLDKIKDYLPDATELYQRVNSVYIELQDLSGEFERIGEDTRYDPSRIEIINERLDLIYSLQQKHRADTVADLLRIKDELEDKIQNISSYDDKLKELENRIISKEKELFSKAEQISRHRAECIPEIQSSMKKLLVSLGIKNAIFIVKQTIMETITSSGIDEVHYLFSANKSAEPQDLSRVASGGEMSRVMLSLKYILSKSRNLPTIIFDEIDTGVSGDIADKMAGIMYEMSQRMQVISITHLPQIAAKGSWHYKVFKYDEGDYTHSAIKLLDNGDRLQEIAKMLSGSNITEAACENAKELLRI